MLQVYLTYQSNQWKMNTSTKFSNVSIREWYENSIGETLRTCCNGTYDDRKSSFASTGDTDFIWRHFLSISSLLSILMVKFWTNLEHDQRKMLQNIFDSEDPSINQNHEISTKFVEWHENKKN